MAESTTIARPYAEAAFGLGDKAGTLGRWSSMLEEMAAVAEHPEVSAYIGNPKLTSSQLAELFLALCKTLDDEGKNFVRLLVENRRLALLPEVRELFEELKNSREGVLEAQALSAFPLDEKQVAQLVAALETKFKKRIQLTTAVDPELVGGVRIVVGDQVVDASVRAKLDAMRTALLS